MATPLEMAKNIVGGMGQALFPGPTGQRPGLHPHGSRTGSERDPLELILGNKRDMFQNMRSPLVRRTMSGNVRDETAPEGLDWLEANGPERRGLARQSWDQPKPPSYSPFPSRAELASVGMEQGADGTLRAAPDIRRSESGVTSIMGPYGGGYSTGGLTPYGNPFQGEQEVFRDGYQPSDPTQEPLMNDEQGRLASNIEAAYNEGVANPRQTVGQREVAKRTDAAFESARRGETARPQYNPFRASANRANGAVQVQPEQAPIEPRPVPSQPPGVNGYTPFETTPTLETSPLYNPEAVEADLADRRGDAILGDSPGILPWLGRQGAMNAARTWDALRNTLWMPGGPQSQESMIDWLLSRQDPALRARTQQQQLQQ